MRLVLIPLLLAVIVTPVARASERLSDRNMTEITLQVNGKGEALIQYRLESGWRRVLVWGALNALPPTEGVPQVRFRHDYAGGWGKYRRVYWRTFRDSCRRYDGPELPYLVAACKAPDGSYWALQRWQRLLPLLGFDPFRPEHDDWELHVSHWSGPPAVLDVSQNWTYSGQHVGLFGRLTYLGRPVHGFGTTSLGNPTDRYGRNVYIDTLNSSYGPGWKRESGIVVHRPTGTFCHSFVPQTIFPGYPGAGSTRPAAPGERYRVTVMGPGVTPVIQWEGAGLGAFDAAQDEQFNTLFDLWLGGSSICRAER